MGTACAKAFGDVLRVNKTLQHLNVSNNSFGRPVVGDQVKLKSSGEMCPVIYVNDKDGRVALIVDGVEDDELRNDSEWEWESHVPAFCAGLADSIRGAGPNTLNRSHGTNIVNTASSQPGATHTCCSRQSQAESCTVSDIQPRGPKG